ncbi:branched-chain amino acid ABC transporter permease [Corynebacterium suranareeae]|uniref:Branched-chain amino acid ABC transporter permease n=1 Tax=Corynebacterium suranareeae TaxID=2506452 RepID=A0A169SD85_9CORY|nr:branched-chain amino acid transporter permease [Corynebacterium suranareeae]BAU97440.1 branched-chain amino acid ABC transporter permease [Corynebacterium suranareeae]
MSEYGLPEGVTLFNVAAVLIPVAIITVLLRQFPYAAMKRVKNNQLMGVLGRTMPVGVMVVLVIYTLFGQVSAPGGVGASLIAVGFTALLHWWRRSAGLSIVGGTLAYMLLVNVVF